MTTKPKDKQSFHRLYEVQAFGEETLVSIYSGLSSLILEQDILPVTKHVRGK